MLAGRRRPEGRRWRRGEVAAQLRALCGHAYWADDGRHVAVAAGERLLLLRKATEGWWQVRRAGESRWARPFFVPATYVAELEPGDAGGSRSTLPPRQPAGAGEQGRGGMGLGLWGRGTGTAGGHVGCWGHGVGGHWEGWARGHAAGGTGLGEDRGWGHWGHGLRGHRGGQG